MSTKDINTLTQSLTNDLNVGFNNSIVYQFMATAAYMESNGEDQEKIDALLDQVKDTNVYKQAKGISTTQTSSETSSYNTVFTNSYGSPETKCNHSGCNNSIASSGDTNCCVMHSNKCLNCGKYVDEDALFCMDCLSGKTTNIEDTGKYSSSSSVPQGGCQYQYFDGSLCGKKTEHYATLCDEHFKQLNDTYNAYVVLAAGFSLADLEVTDGRLVQISDDEELSYLRMYKRLDGDYQDYVKKSIAYCTAKQEKELEAIPESESVKVSRQRNKKK